MNERPTPETDEQINWKPCTRFAIMAGDSLRDALVPSEFARKLERERDEIREQYVAMCSRLQECVQEHGVGLGGEKLDKLVCDDIKAMREAIKDAHEALEACMEDSGELLAEHDWWKDEPRCGYQERYEENKQRIENAKTALAKLQPFLA